MPKIIYAASNRRGARHQLTRVLVHLPKDRYEIRVAGFKHMGLFLDWTLDALLNPFNPDLISLDNDNFEILFNQIKSFNPDLIISDLEYFTSYAGQLLNIPVWQVSPLLLSKADFSFSRMNLNRYRSILYPVTYESQLTENIIINAERKMIYSHFPDAHISFNLPKGFEFVRPYMRNGGPTSAACAHQVMATIEIDKLSKILRSHPDTVIYSNIPNNTLNVKHIDNVSEYVCNLTNSQYFLSDGSTDTLADAFYNGKTSIIIPDLFDPESIINMLISKYFELSKVAYDGQIPTSIPEFKCKTPCSDIRFLHQEIDDFFNS